MSRPLLILPTLRATKETMKICDERFGMAHHKNNRANAFRHALWNYTICEKTLKFVKTDEKALIWAEKVTKLYEKVTKNDVLAQAMDLHNNEIGRMLFLNEKTSKIDDFLSFLTEMMKKAVKIIKIEETNMYTKQLVYISE
ncbi:hypothetical protein [Ulvibacter sp. MAR_2010_11]|uniref:DUF6973 domain-containing protein n=1 Tax=Ulvibacter sp. MAR_2010_11 TaxID=1250229 RepID=UPI000C2C9506|nr:hypothetical protein [Ulvibacter sp. MAR_2010_11]